MLRGQWGNCAGWPGDGSHAGHLVVGVDLSVFFWAPLRHERCVGTCWDMKWFETLSKHVQTIALAVLESWTSGPSYVLQNVIKAYQSISRNIIYIYIYIITYVDISSWFQNMCMASKSSRLDTTRDDVFLRASQAAQGMRPDEACYRNDRHNRTWERWEMNAHLRILRNAAVFSNFLNMKFII